MKTSAPTLDLDIDLLRAFAAVVDNGGFTRAAARLHRTQSAVSMQIRRLEDVVRAPLFSRERKAVTLTPEGERLLGYARRMLRLNDEAYASLARPEIQGHVNLGCPDDFTTAFLPSILARFAETCPFVDVNVTCRPTFELLRVLERGEIDLAIATRAGAAHDWRPLRREPLVWVIGRDDAILERDPLPLALFSQGCLYRERVTAALDDSGRRWRVALASASLAALEAAVAGGLAVTALARGAVPARLRRLEGDGRLPALPPVEIGLLTPPGADEPTLKLAEHVEAGLAKALDGA